MHWARRSAFRPLDDVELPNRRQRQRVVRGIAAGTSPRRTVHLHRFSDSGWRSIVVALPRRAGAYWPNKIDDRAKYASRDVYAMRVIDQSRSNTAAPEAAFDYLFERGRDGIWRLLEVVPLLIVK